MSTGTPALWGRYINLDRSTGRRASMEEQLGKAGLASIRRFPALQGDGRDSRITQGELGCLLSHEAVIASAPVGAYALVLEDDAVLPPDFARKLASCVAAARETWDIMFLSQTGDFRSLPQLRTLLRLKRELGDIHDPEFDRFSLLEGSRWYAAGCGAYVVHPGGVEKLRALLADPGHGCRLPVDLLLRSWIQAGRLTAHVVFPYLVGVDAGATSEIDKRTHAAGLYVSLTELFTANQPVRAVRQRARGYTEGAGEDEDALALSRIIYGYLTQ